MVTIVRSVLLFLSLKKSSARLTSGVTNLSIGLYLGNNFNAQRYNGIYICGFLISAELKG